MVPALGRLGVGACWGVRVCERVHAVQDIVGVGAVGCGGGQHGAVPIQCGVGCYCVLRCCGGA